MPDGRSELLVLSCCHAHVRVVEAYVPSPTGKGEVNDGHDGRREVAGINLCSKEINTR